MCMSTSKPKVQQMPTPPPPPSPVTEDQADLDARQRERRRAAGRSGRRSTILAGAMAAGEQQPTTQGKSVLGA